MRIPNQARINKKNITKSWMLAAADLGIEVVAPWIVQWEDKEYQFIALIKGFGSRNGTLVCSPREWYDLDYGGLAELSGYYSSGLFKVYESYEREHFFDSSRLGMVRSQT